MDKKNIILLLTLIALGIITFTVNFDTIKQVLKMKKVEPDETLEANK